MDGTSNPLMAKLKEKKKHVTGRCAEAGGWTSAEAIPGAGRGRYRRRLGPTRPCYLTDEEIALTHTTAICKDVYKFKVKGLNVKEKKDFQMVDFYLKL